MFNDRVHMTKTFRLANNVDLSLHKKMFLQLEDYVLVHPLVSLSKIFLLIDIREKS